MQAFEAWGMGHGKTGWEEAKKGSGSELRVAFTKSKSLREKRVSSRVGEARGEIQARSIPVLSSSATVE